jgi:hypothetical protein
MAFKALRKAYLDRTMDRLVNIAQESQKRSGAVIGEYRTRISKEEWCSD